jgi:hypothetical protein
MNEKAASLKVLTTAYKASSLLLPFMGSVSAVLGFVSSPKRILEQTKLSKESERFGKEREVNARVLEALAAAQSDESSAEYNFTTFGVVSSLGDSFNSASKRNDHDIDCGIRPKWFP